MNKDLNLVDILKNCPKGTKLYSTIHGQVELYGVEHNKTYPIKYKFLSNDGGWSVHNVTIDGKFSFDSNGECTLFPSKDQRDWSKFNIEPKFDITTLQPFDKVLCRVSSGNKWTCDFFSYISNCYYKFICVGNAYSHCIPYNEETKHLIGTNEMPPKKYINWKE